MQLNEFTTEQLDQLQDQLRKLQHDVKKEQQRRHDKRYQPRYDWDIDPASFGMSNNIDWSQRNWIEGDYNPNRDNGTSGRDDRNPDWAIEMADNYEQWTAQREQEIWEQCQSERFIPVWNQRTQREREEYNAQQRDSRNTNSQQCSQEPTQTLPPSDWRMKDIKQDCYRILGVSNTQQLKRQVDTSDLNLRKKADWQTLWSRLQ